MGKTDVVPAVRSGRPRRFETEDEVRILLNAALVVMERNGYTDAAVADILDEADLSTRSFYRHFESKDQLLCALFRREADTVATRLRAKVDATRTPREALRAWIDEILSFGHDRVKAARVSVLGSARSHAGRGLRRGDAPCGADPDGTAGGASPPRARPTDPSPTPIRPLTRR